MFRKALIYILVLAAVVMVSAAFFLEAYDVCESLYTQIPTGARENGEQVLQFVPITGGRAAVVGRYTKGPFAGNLYYRIYYQNGQVLQEGNFGLEGASLNLVQTLSDDEALRFVCTVDPRVEEGSVYGAVYTVDGDGKMGAPAFYQGEASDQLYDFDKFICTDDDGTYYAGIYNQRVLIFNKDGKVVLRLNPEQTRQVTDVRFTGETFLLAGCTSESGLNASVHRAFCAAYDMAGNKLWREHVLGEEGTLASVLRILDNGENGWIIYGRFTEDSEDEAITEAQQIEALDVYEKGMHFQIEGEQTLESGVFLLGLSPNGQVSQRVAYSEIVPSLVQEDLLVGEGLMLRAYTAKQAGADRYTVKLIRLSRQLQETLRVDIPVWGDMELYCAPSADGKEAGLWIYSNETVQYFHSEKAALEYFTGLKKWRPVCDAALSVGEGAPLIFSLYVIMAICTMGTVRSPHGRQYGRGKRKA